MLTTEITARPDSPRVVRLRQRVRDAMEAPPENWDCPARIDAQYMDEPLAVRKARALALKLSLMPTDLWGEQLFAGSMTLDAPRIHYERGLPDYVTPEERAAAAERGIGESVFGHIVPDYPRLLAIGLNGILAQVDEQRPLVENDEEGAFLDSVEIALKAVGDYAARLADRCQREADACPDEHRATELEEMAANLRQAPAGPAMTFWQALQSVWLLHMIFHATKNGNAMGRVDQYVWPYLDTDLAAGRLDLDWAAELCDTFCLKFNERASDTEEQHAEARTEEQSLHTYDVRHAATSSQRGTDRDRLDATNHWLQNVVVGGLTPEGEDGTNPLTYLLLESYRRNQMTNPLMTLRLHHGSPDDLVRYACEILREGGGMPALFNDEQIVPALERIGIPTAHARDYTNDGCWEIIIPGRTDFMFYRLSLMLCLEWALNRGKARIAGQPSGLDLGDAREITSYDELWQRFLKQVDFMTGNQARRAIAGRDDRSVLAPVPLLSALIDGAIQSRRDMTAGGARFRLLAMLAESAPHAIDSLAAIKRVVFEEKRATMAELCDALDADFEGDEPLRAALIGSPKYGNDDAYADAVGREVIDAFCEIVARHASDAEGAPVFECGVGTFSWYLGIGEGLGASPDGRLAGKSVSPNFSPALGRDRNGLPGAILSYGAMHNYNLPAGGPLDLRVNRNMVTGEAGLERLVGLARTFVATGGNMMTLTVVDTEELRAAQRDPDRYRSLRVRMGGWCAYFTMLGREQQEHHIRRQEGLG